MTRFRKRALLALASGAVFEGYSLGAKGESRGEVVFNTAMTGYQEILTDPSYKGQIVTMTYPLIGNYGVNSEDVESRRPFVEGLVVRESSRVPSSWRAQKSLNDYLEENNIVGIQGIDTRELTMHLREKGSQMGIISTVNLKAKDLVEKARSLPPLEGRDLVKDVTCQEPYEWVYGTWTLEKGYQSSPSREASLHVVAYDFGIKFNILRIFTQLGCRVTVVPAQTPAEDVLAMKPQGVFLSNGPGDPAPVDYAIENAKKLLCRVPLFGICLGHQILGLALGGKTYKLKFGHHGANHPVKDISTGKVEITSQNHGFVVDIDSLGDQVEVTHLNLNDHTVEGLRHRESHLFSIQYHPEASPGPHDAVYLFRRFVNTMRREATCLKGSKNL